MKYFFRTFVVCFSLMFLAIVGSNIAIADKEETSTFDVYLGSVEESV